MATLKEKFDKLLDHQGLEIEENVKQCENVCDEFAMSFGNWLIENEDSYKLLTKSGLDNSYMRRPMKDILLIFKKEKNL